MYTSASESSSRDECDSDSEDSSVKLLPRASDRSGVKRTTLELNNCKSKRPKLNNIITSNTTMNKFDFNSYALHLN